MAAAKGHRGRGYAYSKMKREWTDRIAGLARALEPFMGPVTMRFLYREPSRRRDPDNVSAGAKKFILDGLVSAGILRDDGWAEIAGWTESWELDKKDPGVLVTISDAS